MLLKLILIQMKLLANAAPQNECVNTEDCNKVFTLIQMYHRYLSTPTFHRLISHLIDHNNQTVQFAVIQYISL